MNNGNGNYGNDNNFFYHNYDDTSPTCNHINSLSLFVSFELNRSLFVVVVIVVATVFFIVLAELV